MLGFLIMNAILILKFEYRIFKLYRSYVLMSPLRLNLTRLNWHQLIFDNLPATVRNSESLFNVMVL